MQAKRYPNFSKYIVYTDGRIYSEIKWCFLKPYLSKIGYYQVSLKRDDGRIVKEYAHRILAFLFIPNPANKPHINHKDGNKANNSLLNLEWCTPSENMFHANMCGLRKQPRGTEVIGAKLTLEQLREIIILLEKGVYHEQIARQFGVAGSTICQINTGKRYVPETRAIRKELSAASKP